MNIHNNIKYVRNKEKLTQEEFSKKIGISRNALINYETGKRTPSIDIINKISTVFNVNLNDLLEIEDFSYDFYKNLYNEIHSTTSLNKILEIIFLHNSYLNEKLEVGAPTIIDKKYFFDSISKYILDELKNLELLNMPSIDGDLDGKL